MTDYEQIYYWVIHAVNYKVNGIYVGRIIAPIIFFIIVWISRATGSILLKFFALIVGLSIYFLPNVINIFLTGKI